MHHQCYCVLLLLIISLPNKSGENAPELLHHPSTARWDNTTYFINSPRNQSVQTLREAFRGNSTGNNTWKETNSTSTDREECDKEEDVFARHNVMKNGEGQAYANETRIANVIPIRFKDGIYFVSLPRDTITKNKNHDLKLCCPLGHRLCLKEGKCIVDHNFIFPQDPVIDVIFKKVNFSVNLIWRRWFLRPCGMSLRYSPDMIDPVISSDNEYYFLDSEHVYFPHKNISSRLKSFCVAAVNQTGFDLITCVKIMQTTPKVMATIVSSIFLLITFVVYSVLRELRNIYGYLILAYIASQIVLSVIFIVYLEAQDSMDYSFCASLSFVYHFALYSVYLWRNVTCFDMWRTFRGFRRLHKKERKADRMRKTFVIYSLYVWGVSFVVTILTIIMDFVPNTSEYLIKPYICKLTVLGPPQFWLNTQKAMMIYFHLPIGFILICNTCLFVWTALKILYDKKRINRQMRDSESRRHDDCNKKRLWMYLKLCFAMGINWIPIQVIGELLTWINRKPDIFIYFDIFINFIIGQRGIIFFIMFVCKKKVLRLLMKRFGWSGENLLCHFRVRRSENRSNRLPLPAQ